MQGQKMPTRQEVTDFLSECKAAIEFEHRTFLSRPNYLQGLIDLGLTENQAWEIIGSLDSDNYHDGPQPEHDKPSNKVWEFGYDVEGTEAYIKLRLSQDPNRSTVQHLLVWSFHRAKFAMRYPFRKGKK